MFSTFQLSQSGRLSSMHLDQQSFQDLESQNQSISPNIENSIPWIISYSHCLYDEFNEYQNPNNLESEENISKQLSLGESKGEIESQYFINSLSLIQKEFNQMTLQNVFSIIKSKIQQFQSFGNYKFDRIKKFEGYNELNFVQECHFQGLLNINFLTTFKKFQNSSKPRCQNFSRKIKLLLLKFCLWNYKEQLLDKPISWRSNFQIGNLTLQVETPQNYSLKFKVNGQSLQKIQFLSNQLSIHQNKFNKSIIIFLLKGKIILIELQSQSEFKYLIEFLNLKLQY